MLRSYLVIGDALSDARSCEIATGRTDEAIVLPNSQGGQRKLSHPDVTGLTLAENRMLRARIEEPWRYSRSDSPKKSTVCKSCRSGVMVRNYCRDWAADGAGPRRLSKTELVWNRRGKLAS